MKTQDPVHPFGQPFIMRGNNSRRAFLPHEAEEFSKNDIGSMFVQIAGRLVSTNKGRAVGERASVGDALLFASRSEERRVGQEGVSTCRSPCAPDHYKIKTIQTNITPTYT